MELDTLSRNSRKPIRKPEAQEERDSRMLKAPSSGGTVQAYTVLTMYCFLMRRRERAFLLAPGAILLIIITLVLLPSSSPVTTESLSTSTSGAIEPALEPVAFVSPVLPDGLQLVLTLSSPAVSFGGTLTGQATVKNTSQKNVTVTTLPRPQNVTEWSDYVDTCPSGYFIGYSIFAGHLTGGNISSAKSPLELVPRNTGLICPPPEAPLQITFSPGTLQTPANETFNGIPPFSSLVPDRLNLTTTFPNTQDSQFSTRCGCSTPGLVGYWSSKYMSSGASGTPQTGFVPFSPGEYTVVAWDAWNQYVYATFVVRPNPVSSQPVSFRRTDGNWSFTVSLSSLVVPRGQPIMAYVNITNVSGQTQTIREDYPLVNPTVYSANGTRIWAWNPSRIYREASVAAGAQLISGSYYFSTSTLVVGKNYTLSIWPLIEPSTSTGRLLLGASLMVNATISVIQA